MFIEGLVWGWFGVGFAWFHVGFLICSRNVMKYCIDGFVWNRFGAGFASLGIGLGLFWNSFGEVWGWFCCISIRIFKKRGETLPSLIRLGRVVSSLFV